MGVAVPAGRLSGNPEFLPDPDPYPIPQRLPLPLPRTSIRCHPAAAPTPKHLTRVGTLFSGCLSRAKASSSGCANTAACTRAWLGSGDWVRVRVRVGVRVRIRDRGRGTGTGTVRTLSPTLPLKGGKKACGVGKWCGLHPYPYP